MLRSRNLGLAAWGLASALAVAAAQGQDLPCRPGSQPAALAGERLLPSLLRPQPRPMASDPYAAAQLGIDWLMLELCTWMQTTGQGADCATGTRGSCMGCHVQAETVLGLARSSRRCYSLPWTACASPTDESPLEFAASFTAGCQRKACIVAPFNTNCTLTWGYLPTDPNTLDGYPPELGSIGHYPDCGSNAPPASVHPVIQSAHGGLSLAGYTAWVSPTYAPNLLALSNWFVGKQDPSGRWVPDRFEAPVDQGELFVTSAAITALKWAIPHASPLEAAQYDAAIQAGVNWVRTSTRTTTQDKTFALLAFVDANVPAGDADRDLALLDLLDDQNPDGGWSERLGLLSNPYATGQALYALLEAGEPIDAPAVCSGIGWLVARQNPDGSWSLGTPGVETDSGRNSFFTATIWPVLALGSLRPWGANVLVPDASVSTCAETTTFTLTVAHAADTACGLFARPDVYDLVVTNDLGDIVTVDPPQVTLESGRTATVTVTWTRVGPPRPAGSMSTTTLALDSEGAAAAGCPVEVSSLLTVTTPPDPVPGPMGFGLRVARDRGDLVLDWPSHGEPLGGYELVALRCAERDACEVAPTRGWLDASVARRLVPPGETRMSLRSEAEPWGAGLVHYKLRAVSPCEHVPGPTCNFACTDPRACHAGCP